MGPATGLRRVGSALIFVVVLLSYTVQTELAQWVQQSYTKPYFLLYLTHSGYVLVLPLHLLTLRLLGIHIAPEKEHLWRLLRHQFRQSDETREDGEMWIRELARKVVCLTFLIALPALTWYLAVPLTSMTNITALYNTSAFWVYCLALRFLGERFSMWRIASVGLSVFGVFVIAYGDSAGAGPRTTSNTTSWNSRMIGNGLAIFGSVAYAWYEIYYKLNISPPSALSNLIASFSLDDDDAVTKSLLSSSSASASSSTAPSASLSSTPVSTTTLLLHSNTVTTLIGLATLLLLWIPIPLLHYAGWENFALPPHEVRPAIVGIIMTGVMYNTGFMVLLSTWGPVLASVGNLCTLVLVVLADTLVTHHSLTSWSIAGSTIVVVAFALLVFSEQRGEAIDDDIDKTKRSIEDVDRRQRRMSME